MVDTGFPQLLAFWVRSRRLVVAMVVLACGLVAVAILQPWASPTVDLAAWGPRPGLLFLALGVAFLIRCLLRSRRRGVWLVAGAIVWVGGHLPLAFAGEVPPPILAYYVHGVASLLCAISLIQFRVAPPVRWGRARTLCLIDLALVSAGLGTATWFFIVVPALQAAEPPAVLSRLALRAGADLVLLAALIMVMPRLTRAWEGSLTARLLLGAGLGVVATADLFSPTPLLHPDAASTFPVVITGAGLCALLLLSALDRRRARRIPTPSQAPIDVLEPIWRVLLPVGFVGLVATLVIEWEMSDRLDPYGRPVLFGAMLTFSFAVLRLALALREARQMAMRLSHQVDRDPLTGLLNHRAGHERAAAAIAWANATRRAGLRAVPVSLALIDVDNFKTINDDFGHQAGDIILRALADLFKTHCRPGDIAVRYAGDEFLLILPGMDATAAASLGTRLMSEIRARHTGWVPAGGRVSLSIGIAVSHGLRPAPQVIAIADAAMYDAKRAGKDRVLITDADTMVTLPATHTRPVARFLHRQPPVHQAG